MLKIIDFIMKIIGYERIENIKIPSNYKTVRVEKLNCKMQYYNITGCFMDDVIVNRQNQLLDGYTTICICNNFKIKYVKVKIVDFSYSEYQQLCKYEKRKNKWGDKNEND